MMRRLSNFGILVVALSGHPALAQSSALAAEKPAQTPIGTSITTHQTQTKALAADAEPAEQQVKRIGQSDAPVPSATKPQAEPKDSVAVPADTDGAAALVAQSKPPTVVWDAAALTLTVHAKDVAFEDFHAALVAAGLEVKSHPSWRETRISVDFDTLPLDVASKYLFGRTFILDWRHAAKDQKPSPRILLMARAPGDPTTLEIVPPVSTAEGATVDAEQLKALAEEGPGEKLADALTAALKAHDYRLREQAMTVLAANHQLMIDQDLLYQLAAKEKTPSVRTQALGLVVKYGFGLRSLDALENTGSPEAPVLTSKQPAGDPALTVLQESVSSPIPEVSQTAQEAIKQVAEKQQWLSTLTQEQRNWLFKEDLLGPLSKQLQ